ncbi:MAG: hypothetical protein LBF67_09190, partial [Prevotellaceae bacterium]|nr:hypothetical protein [Prevotellaceae bacterium]
NPSSKARAKPRAEPSGGGEKYYGGDTVVNNLLDAMIHPTDVFVTAANLLSAMGESYFDSINNQIDSVLAKANMQDTIALDLAEYIGADASIAALVVGLDINSTLPFEVKLKASFVDVESSIIDTVFNKEKKISHTKEFTKTELDGIAKSKEGVMLGVKCEKKETITEAILRNLSQQTVSFSLRVKVQAPMNKLDF